MENITAHCRHPEKSTITMLQLINLNHSDERCICLTLLHIKIWQKVWVFKDQTLSSTKHFGLKLLILESTSKTLPDGFYFACDSVRSLDSPKRPTTRIF